MSGAKQTQIAEQLADWASQLEVNELPDPVVAVARRLLLDVTGLCVAARYSDYVRATLTSCHEAGAVTLIGHRQTLDPFSAALLNGTAAHGEDYDDTFEGTPVHVGAVVVPAALAVCERYGCSGRDLLRAITAGGELMCRMALVAPTAIHRAGFHPTAVIGALGAALSVSVALRLTPQATTAALGVAGSMASGIIEYLAEGTWTKRLHAGWAAQSGLRAALLARSGFSGPRSVIEGRHGFFHAFTNADVEPNFDPLRAQLGRSWQLARLAFKPYPCGTMTQPFIDCALRLHGRGITPEQIESVVCQVGAGTVHRLWQPLAEKRQPSSPYSAKFSVPYCIAVALTDGRVGLAQFSERRVGDPTVLALAERVSYQIDPDNDYPRNYSARLQVRLRDGAAIDLDQPHLRGGDREPLTDAELSAKFYANAAAGDWPESSARSCRDWLATLFDQDSLNLSFLRG